MKMNYIQEHNTKAIITAALSKTTDEITNI